MECVLNLYRQCNASADMCNSRGTPCQNIGEATLICIAKQSNINVMNGSDGA
jgi:hypothetical protein